MLEETGWNGENKRSVASHWQTLSHNVVSSTPRHELTTLVAKNTDCMGSCKSNYHTIMTTTVPTTLICHTVTTKIESKKVIQNIWIFENVIFPDSTSSYLMSFYF